MGGAVRVDITMSPLSPLIMRPVYIANVSTRSHHFENRVPKLNDSDVECL